MGDTVQDTTSATSPAGAENKITIGSYLRANLREYGLLFALIIVMVSFQVMTSGILMKPLNITNLVLQNSYIVIMAIGMLLVIVSGNIDLSVG
ncbi:MAG: sugar ABC transporter permease, partial [Maritimibacter sp.]